jgi:hypothetical protein
MTVLAIRRFAVLVGLCLLGACRHQHPNAEATGRAGSKPSSSSSASVAVAPSASVATVAASSVPIPRQRALGPPTGTVTATARPVLRVTPGTEGIELCKTRACNAPQKAAVGADGRVEPPSDLQRGTWFWRVAAQRGTSAGPLWSILVRPSAGHASRVHGFDANGDGRADLLIEAGILFGAAAVAEELTPVPYAPLDARPDAGAPPAPITPRSVTMIPVGDVDGDGFDDAVLEGSVARGGPSGFRPESEWLACPSGKCGIPVGDVDGDGYADLLNEGMLQLGSPAGFRELAAPLLAGVDMVRSAGDLDGDGIADLVVLGKDKRTLSVLRGGKAGVTPGGTAVITTPTDAEVEVGIGDIDGDGIPDIVTAFSEDLPGPRHTKRMTVVVRSTLPGGDIAHGTERRVTSSMNASEEGAVSTRYQIADVDGDGFDDIVLFFADRFGGNGRLARGCAAGVRLQARPVDLRLDVGSGLTALRSVGDLNGDGRDDIVVEGRPQIGFLRTFDLHAGSKTGFAPRLFASYNWSDSDRVAERRLPPRTEDSP